MMNKSFTLPELLVTTGTIGVIAALTLPSLSHARNTARDRVCASQIHQIALPSNELPYVFNSEPFYEWLDFPNNVVRCPRSQDPEELKSYSYIPTFEMGFGTPWGRVVRSYEDTPKKPLIMESYSGHHGPRTFHQAYFDGSAHLKRWRGSGPVEGVEDAQ